MKKKTPYLFFFFFEGTSDSPLKKTWWRPFLFFWRVCFYFRLVREPQIAAAAAAAAAAVYDKIKVPGADARLTIVTVVNIVTICIILGGGN